MINPKEPNKKVVSFSLSKEEMDLSSMVKEGYKKDEVVELFKKLEELSYGQRIPGKRGRNGVEKFIPNETCPSSFNMIFHKRKYVKEKDKQIQTQESELFPEIMSVNKVVLEVPLSDKKGYVISFSENEDCIFLERLSHGGYETIEQAVRHIFFKIKDKICLPKINQMNEVQQIASALRGKSFFLLDKK